MDGASIPENIRVDEHGRLVQDLECVKCKYNLRTIHADAACPECGTAVGRSFLGNRLRYCNPKWLAGVWHGLNCLAAAAGCVTVLFVFPLVFGTEFGHGDLWSFVMAATIAIGLVLAIIGVWRASLPDPDRIEREPAINGRHMARICLTSSAVLFVVFLTIVPFASMDPPRIVEQATEALGLLLGATFILGLLAIL